MTLVHCSYHKCLTAYYSKVISMVYNRIYRFSCGYHHFNSLIDDFYRGLGQLKVASVNNHRLDFEMLGDSFRLSRFVRDPRDLVISGYFYHKRGADSWCNIVNPRQEDWAIVNGCIPRSMPPNCSYAGYLQSLDVEEGLIAEMDFRQYHFEGMLAWPRDDPRIKLFRYEDVLGNEAETFAAILKHYERPWLDIKLATVFAERYSALQQHKKSSHIRNAHVGQWREHFTSKVSTHFEDRYGPVLNRYEYA